MNILINMTIIDFIVGIWVICFVIVASIILGCMAYIMLTDTIRDVKKRKKGE